MTDSNTSSEPAVADIRTRILDIIVREGMVDREKLVGTATLDEVGVQSIDMVIILNAIEDEFSIYIPIDQTLNDVRDVDGLVEAMVRFVENPVSPPRSTGQI